MAKAICCDRCGYFQKLPARSIGTGAIEQRIVPGGWRMLEGSDLVNNDYFPKTVLCAPCSILFDDFMKGPR